MNEKTMVKYHKFCATFKLILLDFPSQYMMKSRFSHVCYLLNSESL